MLQDIWFIIALALVCMVVFSGCGEVELIKLGISTEEGRLTITTGFSKPTPYAVSTEQQGNAIVIKVPGAVVSDDIPKERLINGNDLISGWFAREQDDALAITFYMTGSYAFSHSTATKDTEAQSDPEYSVFVVVKKQVTGASAAADVAAEPGSGRLARGVRLFSEGRFDEALTEFNAEVLENTSCPLAYYYAARIRLEKKQLSRAVSNLHAAIRDSSGFVDAHGYLAYTLKLTGRNDEALTEWRRFIGAFGTIPDSGPIGLGSIIAPDEYKTRLSKAENERKVAEARRIAARETAETPSETPSDSTSSGETAAQTDPAAADSASVEGAGENNIEFESIERRIASDIRRGLYGIAAAIVILSAGIIGVVVWLRKKRKASSAVTFSREVEQFMMESGEDRSLGESDDIREFETKKRIISGRDEPEEEEEEIVRPADSEYRDRIPAVSSESADSVSPVRHLFEEASGRQPITEEVKALVTRMSREGRSTEDICRAADLTRTEVELIIAVRAKHIEQLIDEVSEEEEEPLDTDHLYIAISELMSEGDSPRDIARKLHLSTSEINFALAVMNSEGHDKR